MLGNRPITEREFQIVRAWQPQVSNALAAHEQKPFWYAGYDKSKFHALTIENRNFIVIANPIFKEILLEVLPEACLKHANKFGKHSTQLVLEAFYEYLNLADNVEELKSFLQHEKNAWCCEIRNEVVQPDVLRLELFRKIDVRKNGDEFTGGLLHALKHFSFRDKQFPLSTDPKGFPLNHPKAILEYIIRAFFFQQRQQVKAKEKMIDYTSSIEIEEKNYLFVFGKEKTTGIYFVNSVRRQ